MQEKISVTLIKEDEGHNEETAMQDDATAGGGEQEDEAGGEDAYSLLLEETKSLPIFWNGSSADFKLAWTPKSEEIEKCLQMTFTEVLQKFTASNYIKYCKVTAVLRQDNVQTLRMSDKLMKLFASGRRQHKLLLEVTVPYGAPREIPAKYLLILNESNQNKVFWDGRRPVSNLIVRVNDSQMVGTIETCLRQYVAVDYLNNSHILVANRGESKDVAGDAILGTIYAGNSATVRLSVNKPEFKDKDEPEFESADAVEENAEDREMKEYDEAFWIQGNWVALREQVQYQFEALDFLKKQRHVTPSQEELFTHQKQKLESAMRRRHRKYDEVWRHCEELRVLVDKGFQDYPLKGEVELDASALPPYPRFSNETPPPSDSVERFDVTQTTTSCVSFVTDALRGLGVEIIDEDQRISPVTSMALTVALVAFLCVLTHCVS